MFPHIRSIGDPDQLEEERRLCYVGITRARERLYLLNAWSRSLWGNLNYNPASRFLYEIPQELISMAGESKRRPSGSSVGRKVVGRETNDPSTSRWARRSSTRNGAAA